MSAIKTSTYEKRSVMNTTVQAMSAFHADATALQKLTPPPIFVQIRRDARQSLTEGEVEFTLWFGPLPLRWIARHEPGPTATSFTDVMVQGPMTQWEHQHIFEQVPNGTALIDRVTLAHKPGLKGMFTRLMFSRLSLKLLFSYRHLRTRLAVEKKLSRSDLNGNSDEAS